MSGFYRCLLLIVACLTLSTLLARPERVQATVTPLYVELGDGTTGDLFSYTPASLKRLTNYGYNTRPILSPDSKYIAYGSYAQTYIEDAGRSGAPAVNIWLMDTANGNARRIADQPADTRRVGDTRIRPFIARSDPVWSPDSQSLAWLEDAEGTNDTEADQNEHLLLYSLASGTRTEIYKQPISGAGCPCSSLTWTVQGINVSHADAPNSPFSLRVLDIKGKLRSEIPFDNYPSVKWLNGENRPTMVTATEIMTLDDNVRSSTLPPLEIYSLSAPNGLRFRSNSGFFDAQWSIVVPGTMPLAISPMTDYAISRDGSLAAYIAGADNALYIFDGKQSTQLDLSGVKVRNIDPIQAQGLAWSPLAIRLQVGP